MYASAGGGRRASMHTARAARAPSPPPLRDVSPLSKLRLGTAPGPQHGRTPRLGSSRSRDKRPRDLSNSREQWHFCRAAGVAGAQGTVGAERGPASPARDSRRARPRERRGAGREAPLTLRRGRGLGHGLGVQQVQCSRALPGLTLGVRSAHLLGAPALPAGQLPPLLVQLLLPRFGGRRLLDGGRPRFFLLSTRILAGRAPGEQRHRY